MEEKEMPQEIIAVCGLICSTCSILKAHTDKEAAESVVGWFKSEKWLKENEGVDELLKNGPLCSGCRGDRSVHWAADCWILQCCVDDKKLLYCSECDEFPCKRLVEWSKENKHYTSALLTLKNMKKNA